MFRLLKPALALAAISYVSIAAAQSTIEAPTGSGQRFQGAVLINPATGAPYSASPGTSNTVAPTAAGTSATTANPVQGVTNGVPVTVVPQDNTSYSVSATAVAPLIGTGTDQTTGAISTNGASSVVVELTDTTYSAITVEQSNTGTGQWGMVDSQVPSAAGPPSAYVYTSGVYIYAINAKYIRVRNVATAGTNSAVVNLKFGPANQTGLFVTSSVGTSGGNPAFSAEVGSSAAAAGIPPTVTQSGTSQVAKASQGNLFTANAMNLSTTAGYCVTINAAGAPASGAAITPVDFAALGGTVGSPCGFNYNPGPPEAFSTGIVFLITTSLTTYTPGGAAMIKTMVR